MLLFISVVVKLLVSMIEEVDFRNSVPKVVGVSVVLLARLS